MWGSVCVCSLIVWELGCSRPPERQRGGSGGERFQRAGKVQLLAIRSLWLQLTKSMLYFVFVIVFCCCICIFPPRCEQAGHKKCDRACGSRRAAIICRNLWQHNTTQHNTTSDNTCFLTSVLAHSLEIAKSVGKYKDIKLKIRCQGQALPRYT